VHPAALLFDLDGTLVDSERESAEAMVRALWRGQSIRADQSDRDYVIGRSWVAIFERLQQRYPQLHWTRDQLIAQTAALREEVFIEQGVTILPGAKALLANTLHVQRALVTGSSRVEAAQALRFLGESAVFPVVMAAEDVAQSKPSPLGYLQACQALAVKPADCLVLEDSQAGIAAGIAAGCTVVAVAAGNFAGWDQSAAHFVVPTLEAITHEWLAHCMGTVR
jgi:HAD superfamily hydrolase (TIGR01509 family)